LNLLGEEKRMKIQRSLLRNNKGVSEIIGSLILVLIVSAAGVLAYSISLTAFSSSTSNFQLQMDQREAKARERLAVLAVWWNMSSEHALLNLPVLNYGTTDLAVDTVYVNGTPAATYLNGRGVMIGPWNVTCVKFVSSMTIVTGTAYDMIVVSERGSKNEISWQA
jgi:flagellin-like protein